MNLVRALGTAGWAVRSALSQASRGPLWLPFLLVAAIQTASLMLLMAYGRGAPVPLVGTAARAVGGEAGTHFPFFYAVVPVLLARWNLILSACLFTWATAVAVLLFAGRWGRGLSGSPWRAAARRYPALLAIGCFTALLSLVIFWIGNLAGPETLAVNRNLRWGTRFAMMAVFIAAQSLFVYAILWVVLERRGWARALGDSIRLALRTAFPTLLVVGIPVLLLYPIDYLSGRADLFLTRLRPDLIGTILLVKIVLEAVLGFVLVGAITRLFLWRLEEEK